MKPEKQKESIVAFLCATFLIFAPKSNAQLDQQYQNQNNIDASNQIWCKNAFQNSKIYNLYENSRYTITRNNDLYAVGMESNGKCIWFKYGKFGIEHSYKYNPNWKNFYKFEGNILVQYQKRGSSPIEKTELAIKCPNGIQTRSDGSIPRYSGHVRCN